MKTDPIKKALYLRRTLKAGNHILVADFSDTLQGKDTSKVIETMPIVGTQNYVFRTKVNVKEIDPIASKRYDVKHFDLRFKSDKEIEDFIKKSEFDFPLWFKHNGGFSMKNVGNYNPPFVLQVAGCNFHDGTSRGGCQYCFVDDKSNNGKPGQGKALLSTGETIDSMISAREKIKKTYEKEGHDLDIKVLRVSGGEPTLVLDWILDLWRDVRDRGVDFVGQIDSNLSTGTLIERFETEGVYEKHILEKLAEYPIKVLTAIKGTDEKNQQDNVQSETCLVNQEYSLMKFLKAGFDIYPQMYNPNPITLKHYLSSMDDKIENFSLKVHIGPLKVYSPTKVRLGDKTEEKRVEWDENYRCNTHIIDSYLRKRFGVGYKEITRSDVKLRII